MIYGSDDVLKALFRAGESVKYLAVPYGLLAIVAAELNIQYVPGTKMLDVATNYGTLRLVAA